MIPPINPEAIINGLANPDIAAQVYEQPKGRELLWFLQWKSFQPGGLDAMCREFVERYIDRLLPQVIQDAGKPKSGAWTLKQCLPVWQAYANCLKTDFGVTVRIDNTHARVGEFDTWTRHIDSDESPTAAELRELSERTENSAVERFNYSYFRQCHLKEYTADLPELLYRFCHLKPALNDVFGGLKTILNLLECLVDYMDCKAREASRQLGSNRVTTMVFDRLDFALSSKYPVMILGDARVGKTKSVSTWCEMRPGLARLVTMPDTNREWEFLTAHAAAFGLPFDARTSSRALKRSVELLAQRSGLFLIYDEFHFALPVKYQKNSVPSRLNWIRCQVIDKGNGCAFFATRQTYQTTLDKFVQATRFNMDQWDGRIAAPLLLPAEFNNKELHAAALAKFPGFDPDLLELIVERCIQHESGFKHMEPVAKYALWEARKAGREQPSIEDVDIALLAMLPSSQAAPAAAPIRRSPAPKPQAFASRKQARNPAAPVPAPAQSADRILPGRTVEPICPERGEIELHSETL